MAIDMSESRDQTAQIDLAADRERALALTPVSRETAERLDVFVDCLLRWQQTRNLIAASTIPEIWTRHVADSLQLLPLASDANVWIDLGSGAGFPGLVIACALAGRPGAAVHLVESTGKKTAFLQEAVRVTQVPASVHRIRIEDFVRDWSGTPDVICARALAPMKTLLGYVHPLMKTGAQALLLKGQDVDAELTEASKYWSIRYSLVASRTAEASKIVNIRGLESRKG
jgi:16S rRNA (guanine527-N7)-methyltransferase